MKRECHAKEHSMVRISYEVKTNSLGRLMNVTHKTPVGCREPLPTDVCKKCKLTRVQIEKC